MKLLFTVCLAIAALTVSATEVKDDNGVLVLTKDNFKGVTTDNDYVLVEFCKYPISTITKTILVPDKPAGLATCQYWGPLLYTVSNEKVMSCPSWIPK